MELQKAAPGPLTRFGGQVKQSEEEELPLMDPYFPATQSPSQVEELKAALKVPALQSLHREEPSVENFPGLQPRHVLASEPPGGDFPNFPALHALQETLPSAYSPTLQGVQLEGGGRPAPEMEILPGGHGRQAEIELWLMRG